MSKISFPKDGLTQLTSGAIANCKDYLSQAASECYFDVPSDFGHKDYLWGLRSKINEFNSELILIRQKISTTDHSYANITSRASMRIRKYERPPRIKPRERLVK